MPTWGDHKGSGRRHARRKTGGRRHTDRGRHRKSGCRAELAALAVKAAAFAVVWLVLAAVILVPLILWGPA